MLWWSLLARVMVLALIRDKNLQQKYLDWRTAIPLFRKFSKEKCSFGTRVWHSWKFWYEWISEYIRIRKMIRIWYKRIFERISEYIHIKKQYEWISEYFKKNDTNMIRTNIHTGKYSNIFEYPSIRHTHQCTVLNIFGDHESWWLDQI